MDACTEYVPTFRAWVDTVDAVWRLADGARSMRRIPAQVLECFYTPVLPAFPRRSSGKRQSRLPAFPFAVYFWRITIRGRYGVIESSFPIKYGVPYGAPLLLSTATSYNPSVLRSCGF